MLKLKSILYFHSLLLLLIANSLFSQEIKKGFEIERKTREDGKSSVSYKEVVACPPRMSPKDVNGQEIEFMGSVLNSREKLNQIERTIFSEGEIKHLSASPCIVHCRVSTNGGKVVEVQFYFPDGDPLLSEKKLAKYARLIRQEITFNLHFSREIHQHGYIYQSFPVFRSLKADKANKAGD